MDTDQLVAVAFVSHGQWVARCPRRGCLNAEGFGPDAAGAAGGLTGSTFRCREEYGGCGLRCAAVWPAQVDLIDQVLRARPVPATRNWQPGEPVVDLVAENLEHGAALPDGIADRVLEAMPRRPQIGA